MLLPRSGCCSSPYQPHNTNYPPLLSGPIKICSENSVSVAAGFAFLISARSFPSQPVSLDVASDNLFPSGLFNIRFRFHDPPQKVLIRGISVKVLQSVELQTKNGDYQLAGKPSSLTVFTWDGIRHEGETAEDGTFIRRQHPLKQLSVKNGNLFTLQPGKGKDFSDLAQLPDDAWLRPSTIRGVNTPMKISHCLQVHIHFQSQCRQPEIKQYIFSRPVNIASVRFHRA